MFKNIAIGSILSTSLFLAGCNAPTITAAQIQQATLAACNFEPTAVEVAGLIPNVSTTVVSDANSIATAICAAVKKSSTTTTPTAPTTTAAKRRATAPVTANVVLPNGQIIKVTGNFVQ